MTKEELLQKLTLVAMDHADITTLDKPIIGTHSLAPCLGILLYDEEKKMALVAKFLFIIGFICLNGFDWYFSAVAHLSHIGITLHALYLPPSSNLMK